MDEAEDINDNEPFERVPDPDYIAYEQSVEASRKHMEQMRAAMQEARKEYIARGGVFGHGYSPQELAEAKAKADNRTIRYIGGFEGG